jgi:DivIVA domain-containing protein
VTYAGRVDRDAIERRDFPVGRRGYDQAAVDAHLRVVADAFESLRDRPAPPSAAPLSAGASEQVRVILEAAEAGAARLRADAEREAGEHIASVQEAAAATMSRLDDLERELATLRDALRRSGEQLTGELARFRDQVAPATAADAGEPPVAGEDFAAAAPTARADGAPGEPAAAAPGDSAAVAAGDPTAAGRDPAAVAGGDPAAVGGDPAAGAGGDPGAGSGGDPTAVAGGDPSAVEAGGAGADDGDADDEAGARLIALNMALSGTPREETARYLAEHFRLGDTDGLLDDVYSRAGR